MTTTIAPPVKDVIAFTAPEKKRLHEAASEIERLEGKLAEIENLRAVITAAESDFVAGKIDITTAAGLLSVTGDINARNELQARLRRPVKLAIKAVVESVAPLISKADAHKVDALAAKAKEVEKAERDSFKDHGLPDDFQPSPLLKALREKHRRALEAAKVVTYTKQSLTALIAGIS